MLTYKVNTSRWKARSRAINAARRRARVLAVKTSAASFVRAVTALAHADTGRWRRAWIDAGNTAGVTSMALPPLRESQFARKFKGVLRRSIRRNRFFLNQAARRGEGEKPWMFRARAQIERDTRLLAQLQPGAIAMNLFGGGREPRIIQRVYGGTGAIYSSTDSVVIVLRSLEPHAAIVESRFGTIRAALAASGRAGTMVAASRYRAEILRRAS